MTAARPTSAPLFRHGPRLAVAWALLGTLSFFSCNGARTRVRRDTVGWWCGAAAGVCTCVEIGGADDAGVPARACGPSDCCFLQDDGSCTCRSDHAAVDCPALKAALHAARPVETCPPP